VREQLAVAKTSAEHLEKRVDDLSRHLAAKEEKLAVYEGRTSTAGAADSDLSREQQLEIELAELRCASRGMSGRTHMLRLLTCIDGWQGRAPDCTCGSRAGTCARRDV
jgi:hypothetical protein